MNRRKLFKAANSVKREIDSDYDVRDMKDHMEKYLHAMSPKLINDLALKYINYKCERADPVDYCFMNLVAPYLNRRMVNSLPLSAVLNSYLLRGMTTRRLSNISQTIKNGHTLYHLPDLATDEIASAYMATDETMRDILLSRYVYKMVVSGKYYSADSLFFVCDIENSTRICRMIRKLMAAVKSRDSRVSYFELVRYIPYCRESDDYTRRVINSNMFSILPPKYAIAAFDLLQNIYMSNGRNYFIIEVIENMCHAHYRFYEHVLRSLLEKNIGCLPIYISRLLRRHCLRARISKNLRMALAKAYYLDQRMFLEKEDLIEIEKQRTLSAIAEISR